MRIMRTGRRSGMSGKYGIEAFHVGRHWFWALCRKPAGGIPGVRPGQASTPLSRCVASSDGYAQKRSCLRMARKVVRALGLCPLLVHL